MDIEPKLYQMIKDFFPKREGERIIGLIKKDGQMERKGSEYRMTLRPLKKLRLVKEMLDYEQIRLIIEDKRGRKKNE